ncbi:hypothetical protein GEMRC1_010980 [Eukaryota sp. GEM-RC1]
MDNTAVQNAILHNETCQVAVTNTISSLVDSSLNIARTNLAELLCLPFTAQKSSRLIRKIVTAQPIDPFLLKLPSDPANSHWTPPTLLKPDPSIPSTISVIPRSSLKARPCSTAILSSPRSLKSSLRRSSSRPSSSVLPKGKAEPWFPDLKTPEIQSMREKKNSISAEKKYLESTNLIKTTAKKLNNQRKSFTFDENGEPLVISGPVNSMKKSKKSKKVKTLCDPFVKTNVFVEKSEEDQVSKDTKVQKSKDKVKKPRLLSAGINYSVEEGSPFNRQQLLDLTTTESGVKLIADTGEKKKVRKPGLRS